VGNAILPSASAGGSLYPLIISLFEGQAVPTYVYQCPHCGRFELKQSFSDATLTTCPTCGRPIRKLITAPPIVFKGSGWYSTDSRGGSSKPAEDGAKNGADGKTEGATDSAKTETKSEAKAEKAEAAPAKSEATAESKA
jgi:putative FmdB family regulatory protein